MKILTIKLFFTLLAGLCLHHSVQAQIPRLIVDGDNAMTEIEHLLSEDNPDHPQRDYLKIKVAHETGNTTKKSIIMEDSGLLVLGTEDPCYKYGDTVYLAVQGAAVKEGVPFWDGISDKRLKKNIASLKKSADKFNDINFYRYEYKKSGKTRYGIMAQEIKDDFPHSVGTFWEDGTKYYTFNPNNLFFMGMKVIQENSQKILEQDSHIHTLETQLAAEKNRNDQLAAEIEAIKAALANAGIDIPVTPTSELESRSATPDDSNLKSAAPRLKQNIPNPFQKSTSIPYYLPSNTQQAALVIHDMTGKTVLQQTLPNQEGEGKVEIDLSNSTLKGGIYTYSLYVNNQLIDTKKLSLLTK